MRKSLLAATAVALIAGSNAASADLFDELAEMRTDKTVTGTIASIDGGLQVIRLDNGKEFKLGTHNTSDDFKNGDKVRIDWRGYMKSYMLANRVRVVGRN